MEIEHTTSNTLKRLQNHTNPDKGILRISVVLSFRSLCHRKWRDGEGDENGGSER
jgi:hypothetical protein